MRRSSFITHAIKIVETLSTYLTDVGYDCMPHQEAVKARYQLFHLRDALEAAETAQRAEERKEMQP